MKPYFLCTPQFISTDETREELYQLLNSLAQPTLQEQGCISYHLHVNNNNPNHFIMVEKFVDEAAFNFHTKQDYIVNFEKTFPKLLAKNGFILVCGASLN